MDNDLKSYDDLVSEIVEFSNLKRSAVKKMVWNEVFNPGINVKQEALDFEIDFHIYNEKMENFYKNAYGFIIETSVESLREGKRNVLKTIKRRISHFINKNEYKHGINILMMGDGVGEDTKFLYKYLSDMVNFFYFDVPGSKTYDFAQMNFKKYEVDVELINKYEDIPYEFFDVIVCLEVLEHLPDPESSIEGFKNFLKYNGIVLVTESFGNVASNFPTHLKYNNRYNGKTPFMFFKHGLLLQYYSKDWPLLFRPMEFIKKENINFKDKIELYFDFNVLKKYFYSIIRS